MSKRKTLVIVVALLLMLSSVGIQSANKPVQAQDMEPIKIGAIFDLTGPTSDVGQFYAEGITGYVEWANANGGIEGHPIELLSEDYAYSVENAENLYIEYVNEGVVAFMGWGTGDTEALRGRIAEDEIPFMSASYSAPLGNPEEAPYNFLVGTTYSDQLIAMLQYMSETWVEDGEALEDLKIVVFHHDSPFGTSPLADGQAWADEHDVNMLSVAMPGGATDYNAQITSSVIEEDATHVIVQNVSTPAALLLRNLDDLGLLDFVQFGCLNWCSDELLVNGAGEAAEGALGALPFGPTTVEVPGQEVPISWLEESGGPSLEEATLHYTQGWWTMAVMVEGIRITIANGEEITGANIKANLETLTDFDTGGITSSPITYTTEDHRGNHTLTIFTVEDGIWVAASDVINVSGEEEDMEEESDG